MTRRLPYLAPVTLMRLFAMYAAPKAEYGAQLWAPFLTAKQRRALDRIQSRFQLRTLLPSATCAPSVPACFAAAEFGRPTMAAHADELALRYLHGLAHAPQTSTLRRLFDARMAAARRRHYAGHSVVTRHAASQSWCSAMRQVCERYGLVDVWDGTTPMPPDASEWRSTCRRAVRDRCAADARAQVAKDHPRVHAHVTALGLEQCGAIGRVARAQPYLHVSGTNVRGREVMTLARCGALPTNALRVALLRDALRSGGDVALKAVCSVVHGHESEGEGATVEGAQETFASFRCSALPMTCAENALLRATLCSVCLLTRGVERVDGVMHLIAECDAAAYARFCSVVADRLHAAVHAARPDLARSCCRARSADAGVERDGVAVSCAGAVVAANFLAASVARQVAACLNGGASWLTARSGLRGREVVRDAAKALVRCTQNFIGRAWQHRCDVLGVTPVVAFAPHPLGRQVMHRTSPSSPYRLLPLPQCDGHEGATSVQPVDVSRP